MAAAPDGIIRHYMAVAAGTAECVRKRGKGTTWQRQPMQSECVEWRGKNEGCAPQGQRPQMMMGAAADNTSAASERVVAIAVLSQLERSAEVLAKTALALALCSLIPVLS